MTLATELKNKVRFWCNVCNRRRLKKSDFGGINPYTGIRYKVCTDCRAKFTKYRAKYRALAKEPDVQKNGNGPHLVAQTIKVGIFLKIPKSNKIGWTIEQAEHFAAGIAGLLQTGQPFRIADIYKKYGSSKPLGACINLAKELRRAAEDPDKLFKQEPTIREYFIAGRPYKIGNRVLAQGKK